MIVPEKVLKFAEHDHEAFPADNSFIW